MGRYAGKSQHEELIPSRTIRFDRVPERWLQHRLESIHFLAPSGAVDRPRCHIEFTSYCCWVTPRSWAWSWASLALLEAEAARQEAEGAAHGAARQPVKALPAAVKQELVEQITAESEERPLN